MSQDEANPSNFGTALSTYRQQAGVSIRRLAREAGLAASTVLRIERGESVHVRARHLQSFAQTLGIDVEELYVAAGLLLTDNLPELQPYLRIKYDLPDYAIDQLDAYFQAFRSQWAQPTNEESSHDDREKET